MKYFVYYNDDYAEMGGVGLEEFDTAKEAEDFILERMRISGKDVDRYTVIKGEYLTATKKEVATKISIG